MWEFVRHTAILLVVFMVGWTFADLIEDRVRQAIREPQVAAAAQVPAIGARRISPFENDDQGRKLVMARVMNHYSAGPVSLAVDRSSDDGREVTFSGRCWTRDKPEPVNWGAVLRRRFQHDAPELVLLFVGDDILIRDP